MATPIWTAPEVIMSSESGKPADVYSFAMVLYALWTEKIPFNGRKDIQLALDIVQKGLRPALPDPDSSLGRLISECWATNPEDRPRFDAISARLVSGEVAFPDTDPVGPAPMMREIHQRERIVQGAVIHQAQELNDLLDLRDSAKSREEVQNLLTQCAREGDVAGLFRLLTAFLDDADINGRDSLGVSPLHAAVESGQLVSVEFIAKVKTADKNIRDRDGNTPLIAAVKCEQQRIVGYLVQRKDVDPNLQNKEGLTALHMVEKLPANWHSPMIMSLAMGKEINWEIVDGTGKTPFASLPNFRALFKEKQEEYARKRS
jgi:serine/threonine protein kinase